jgi:hypothetical protein
MPTPEEIDARKRAIRAKWQDQGFVVMPNGGKRDLRYVTGGFRIADESWFDAVVELVQPNESWLVLFTDCSLKFDQRHMDYLAKHGGLAMAVSLYDPAQKKVISNQPPKVVGYDGIYGK